MCLGAVTLIAYSAKFPMSHGRERGVYGSQHWFCINGCTTEAGV